MKSTIETIKKFQSFYSFIIVDVDSDSTNVDESSDRILLTDEEEDGQVQCIDSSSDTMFPQGKTYVVI